MPKTKKPTKAAPVAKAAPKVLKTTKKAEPKVKLSVKVSKKSQKIEIKAEELQVTAISEDEEEEIEMATAGSGGNSNAALSMAAATAETSASSLKNFRQHPDIENFYRFIFENDLRYEALEIIDLMAAERTEKKSTKAAKARAH